MYWVWQSWPFAGARRVCVTLSRAEGRPRRTHRRHWPSVTPRDRRSRAEGGAHAGHQVWYGGPMSRPPLFFALPLLLSIPLALGACGGTVVTQAGGSGGGGQGGEVTGGSGQGGEGAATTSTSTVGTGGSVNCDGLGEFACLGAYPSCVPVYDNQCCPTCDPTGGCADCVNWGFHHCGSHADGCLPEQPIGCGVVPGWACTGGTAMCDPVSPATKTPCATVPGCVASFCPINEACETDPVCVPAQKDMCSTALCDAVPPDCPDGTVPEVEDGCYTGGCILSYLCGP